MARHQPDLIMCRKQPGIGESGGQGGPETDTPRPGFTSPFPPPQPSAACARNVRARAGERGSDGGRCAIPITLPPTSLFLSSLGDGKCVVCDSYVRPATLVRVCDECNYGSLAGRCVVCGGVGVADAYYCKECTLTEKDVRARGGGRRRGRQGRARRPADPPAPVPRPSPQRDGCPKIVNLGVSRIDAFYDRKRHGPRGAGG
jgi:PHD finger-like domain-containing protein 5A